MSAFLFAFFGFGSRFSIGSYEDLLFFSFMFVCVFLFSQGRFNFDEAKVPPYTLPEFLVGADGSKVQTKEDRVSRRVEILALFEEHVYGEEPMRAVGRWR